MPGLSSFNYQHVAALKAAISLAAAALLAWWWYADRRDKDPKTSRRDGSLAILGVLGFVAWWNFGSLLVPERSVHYWEFFHYYLGSKYSHRSSPIRGCTTALQRRRSNKGGARK